MPVTVPASRRWDPVWYWRIRPVRILILLVLLAVALVSLAPALLEAYARWLIQSDPPTQADVVVVLGGDEGERLGIALRIWREGRVRKIVISEPSRPLLPIYREDGREVLTMGEVKRRVALHQGVPDSSIWLVGNVTSTFEEARASRGLLTQRGIRSAIVVTSPYHTRRATATFRHVYRGTGIRITGETIPSLFGVQDPRRWWTREDDLVPVFSETAKLLFYRVRYGISPI